MAAATLQSQPCEAAAERRLAELEAAPRLAPSKVAALAEEARQAVIREARASADRSIPDSARYALAREKWRAMRDYLERLPFRDRSRARRSEQWREALARVRDLSDAQLIDWICLQIDVARNIERGVQDLRPRAAGPTCIVLLNHVRDRERKAAAALKWQLAAEGLDLDSVSERSTPPRSMPPLASMQAAQQPDQQNDGDRDSDQPKQ